MTATPSPSAARLRVVKGHGTHNDFVLLDGRDGIELDAALARSLADRRGGIGGDGVIRLVRTDQVADGRASLAEDPAATWFMDYRNADGSVAEMCGNGVRVVAAFAERLGLWDGSGEFVLGTRAGVRRVRRVTDPDGSTAAWYAVDMGRWELPGGAPAAVGAGDAEVEVPGLSVAHAGLRVAVGNPHTVVALAGEPELTEVDLNTAPQVTPRPQSGTNVELVVPLGEQTSPEGRVGAIRMRVHERGVGETRSCGTGACAAALAVRAWSGPESPATWRVEVPGGVLRVRVAQDSVELAGPAVLVADVVVDVSALG
jgi:diaminopimelate epimerase